MFLRPFSVVLKKKLTQIGGLLQGTPSQRPCCCLEAADSERATGRSLEPSAEECRNSNDCEP